MRAPRAATAVGILLLVLFAGLGGPDAWALEVPPLTGRVNDTAGMFNPSTVAHLETVLAELERSDSTQLVVVTIPTLEGEVLEAFSIRLFEAWRIGQKGRDNGAILLIVSRERKLRIEVGYGLEGRLTDLVSGRIIRDVIAPRFKAGDFDQGVSDGVAAMVQTVRGEFEALEPPASRGPRGGDAFTPSLIGILFLLLLVRNLSRVKRSLGAVTGAVFAPIAGSVFFNATGIVLLALIPLGALIGLLLGFAGPPLSSRRAVRRPRGRYWGHDDFGGGGFGGGFGGGGFGGGGFSGGGGGGGGGGASGGW